MGIAEYRENGYVEIKMYVYAYVCLWEGVGNGGGIDRVVTPFTTHTIKLPMKQQISGFWDSLLRLISFYSAHCCLLTAVLFRQFGASIAQEGEQSSPK